jgi:hypothetical protein
LQLIKTNIPAGHGNRIPSAASWSIGLAILVMGVFILLSFDSRSAMACPSCAYWVTETNVEETENLEDYISDALSDMVQDVDDHTDQDFKDLQDWYVNELFRNDIWPNLTMMTEQLTATAMQQMEIIGTFLDAKDQLETQRLFQSMVADTRRDYTPSEGVCTVATMTRSLAGTERHVDLTALGLAQRSINRQLRAANSIGVTTTDDSDRASRYNQFRLRYCDKKDNAEGLTPVCAHDSDVSMDELNKDVDFYRTLGRPMTLQLKFESGSTADSDDAQDIFALESNLYAHEIPNSLNAPSMRTGVSVVEAYLDTRSIVAKRSVAENSFQAIAAMKALGETGPATQTAAYMRAALAELGISGTDAADLIGGSPSYYAQMELLTKKIFQRPEFFVDLYDKPANIERKSVALQAISLMQRRDLFKSALRTESMLSILLELDLIKAQDEVENEKKRLQ